MTPPLPTGDVWVQFPLVAVIVACFALAFVGLFFFIRWFWSAYQKNKAADLAWRETQNEKRELAQNTRDEKMIGFFVTVSANNAADIAKITQDLNALLINYGSHDMQAKQIGDVVAEIRTIVQQFQPAAIAAQKAASSNVRTRPLKGE